MTTQNDIYVIDLTKYFTRLFELYRPDALDVPQHIEIRRHLFSKGVDVDFDDIVKTDYASMVDGDNIIPIVRPSLVYWRELGKVLLSTNSRFVTAYYDDPEVNYDGRD